ncbi:MAG: adenine deaminase [Clostridiales bacterium]|jgi:adenine deaminase|nr:adenine deaminase [Clostridiales bacterium]
MLESIIRTALGREKADLVLKNARVLNVFTGEILDGDIAIKHRMIAGVGEYENALEIHDLDGAFVSPGFINTHCHVESSMVTPDIYCWEELKWGVTTLITDPHEVANVAGADGIKFMLDLVLGIPINYLIQLPSCVPSTDFESSGALLDAGALEPLMDLPCVLGLGEVMNYPGVLSCDKQVMKKIKLAEKLVIDGHAPGLFGKELQAYISAGISTDHESSSFDEALEKLRAGMAVLIREGSACKNLEAIVKGIVSSGIPTDRFAFCTDDKHIADIKREGTIRCHIEKAVALGLDAVEAYRMATINASRIYNLKHLGAIAPGYRADLAVLDDLADARVKLVYKDGKLAVPGQFSPKRKAKPQNSIIMADLNEKSFEIPPSSGAQPVIELQERQILTKKKFEDSDKAQSLLESGKLCKIAVIERHRATGNIGVGLISGYGLEDGAIASSVCHDSHNLLVVGTNDSDMLLAANEARRIMGGYVLAKGGRVTGAMPLPFYGLMSGMEADEFAENLSRLIEQAHEMGVLKDIDPFITLSFLALPVIPEIRITDKGVFDVVKFRFISSK